MKYICNLSNASRRLRILVYSGLAVAPIFAAAQAASEDDDDLEELEVFTVTGSNIQRLDIEPVSPVIRMSRDALEATGFSTAGDAIRALPIVSGQSLVSTDAGTSFTPAASSVNLRGLGNNNTLALINGRRVAPYPTPGFNGFQSVVNLNAMPSAAIESIEVLKDGASAIYGSDAVAGVINISLAKSYDGLTTELSVGNTFDTDSFEWGMFAIGGAQSGRMSMVYTVDYRERNSIYGRDLDYTDDADGRDVGSDDLRSSANISANVNLSTQVGWADEDGNVITDPANYEGDMVPWRLQDVNPSLAFGGWASLASLPDEWAFNALPGVGTYFDQGDFEGVPRMYNFQEEAGLFPEERDYGFYTRMNYALTENMDVYVEASFRRSEVQIASASSPAFFINENGSYVDETPGDGLYEGYDGAMYLPAENPYNPFGMDVFDVRWRILEAGQRLNDITVDTPRIVAGLQGDLPWFDWTFDTGILFTESTANNTNAGTVFDDLLQEALLGVVIDGETYYANPFGRNAPEVIEYISGNNPNTDSFNLWSWDFKTSGALVDLGEIGVLSMAVGGEVRFEEMESIGTYSNETGNIVGGSQGSSVFGDRDVTALYGELSLPVYDLLEFQLAARYEDYSDFGDTTKPKIGVKFTPVDGLLLRAAYGESFRAPDLAYLYTASSVSFSSSPLQDPLRPNDPPQQIRSIGGGNPDLQPEETDSFYVGAVVDFGAWFEPLDRLVFSVDLWRFEQTDVISSLSANTIVANAGDPFFDQYIVRIGGPDGVISHVTTQFQNLEAQETQGVDLALQYTLPTDSLGEFRFRVEGTYVDSFEYTDSFGNVEEWAGTWGQPQWRANGTIAWRRADWAASLFIDYVGEYEDLWYPTDVKSYWRFNPQVAYSGLWDTTITLGVRNVFNEVPPIDTNSSITVMAGIHNIEPAFWYMRLQKDW